jgi:hypothetical protein
MPGRRATVVDLEQWRTARRRADTPLRLRGGERIQRVQLLRAGQEPQWSSHRGVLTVTVPDVDDVELVAVDLTPAPKAHLDEEASP